MKDRVAISKLAKRKLDIERFKLMKLTREKAKLRLSDYNLKKFTAL
jgi:hypothetical protein